MSAPVLTPIPSRDAFLLLAAAIADGMPSPEDTSFNGGVLILRFHTLDEGRRWLDWFGADVTQIRERIYHSEGHARRRISHSSLDSWQGWWLAVWAAEPVPEPVQSGVADRVRTAAALVSA